MIPDNDRSDHTTDQIVEFMVMWHRGEELLSVLRKLPTEIVLKAGQSARRNSLISQWEDLESPGLDGSIPDGASKAIADWNRSAESTIAFIINISKDTSANETAPKTYFHTIESIEDSPFISDLWCWPWERKEVNGDKKWNKEKLVKLGVVAGLGLMALVTYLDEE